MTVLKGNARRWMLIIAQISMTLSIGCKSEPPRLQGKVSSSNSITSATSGKSADAPTRLPESSEKSTNETGPTIAASEYDFAKMRSEHRTSLITQGASPQSWSKPDLPEDVTLVTYTSDGRELRGWLAMPQTGSETAVPGVVYFHGGFAFGAADFEDTRQFLQAGYAVFIPQFRGENGQDGHFEMMYGEVADALAAVKWFAARPEVDSSRIVTFGHSSGANISAMISLFPDAPVRLTGGAGGLYEPNIFEYWKDHSPFDISDKIEREIRIFTPHIDDMQHPHIAYVGADDPQGQSAPLVARTARKFDAPLTVYVVPGDHFSSLQLSIKDFIARINERQ